MDLRTDVLTGRQVILAANRAERPMQVRGLARTSDDHESVGDDPFLEGRESETPHEFLALRRNHSAADAPGWLLRVVPNRFPAVGRMDDREKVPANAGGNPEGPRASLPSLLPSVVTKGSHEVVIECADHRRRMADLSIVEIARILVAWQHRICQLVQNPTIQAVSIFRNEGVNAGASLPHCHSQILATDFIPAQLRQRVELATAHQHGLRVVMSHAATEALGVTSDSLHHRWLELEISEGVRVVTKERYLTVLCPFASRVPWQVQLAPMQDEAFQDLPAERLIELATTLQQIVRTQPLLSGPLDHNLVLHLPPVHQPEAFPWLLEFLPRSSRIAGYELGTDVDILTVAPESAAAAYKSNLIAAAKSPTPQELTPVGFAWSQQGLCP